MIFNCVLPDPFPKVQKWKNLLLVVSVTLSSIATSAEVMSVFSRRGTFRTPFPTSVARTACALQWMFPAKL
jgi:hypothetical protein